MSVLLQDRPDGKGIARQISEDGRGSAHEPDRTTGFSWYRLYRWVSPPWIDFLPRDLLPKRGFLSPPSFPGRIGKAERVRSTSRQPLVNP
jgi:hypothetical protein